MPARGDERGAHPRVAQPPTEHSRRASSRHDSTRLRSRALRAWVITLTALVCLPARASTMTSHQVSGTVLSSFCVELSARDYDPGSNRFECTARQKLQGDWSGTGTVHATGTVDPVSGDAHGTFSDDLRVTLPNGASGTVQLRGELYVDGSSMTEWLRGRIVNGDGFLRRAHGQLTMSGTSPLTGGPAIGSYQGAWARA